MLKRRQEELDNAYEKQWAGGSGSHHPDFKPAACAVLCNGERASRETEELYNAIVKNDVGLVYTKIEEGADVNYTFGAAYGAPEGYTPLMVALVRGRYEAAKALLRAGADPNYMNSNGDLAIFCMSNKLAFCNKLKLQATSGLCSGCLRCSLCVPTGAIDGGAELIKLMHMYGADLNSHSPAGWTPLTYAKAHGKYGLVDKKGIYPEDVLRYYGASVEGDGPPVKGTRSPRESFDASSAHFSRDRYSYQDEPAHP